MTSFDVGVIGGGSAANTLVAAVARHGWSSVVFEPKLVGGECPYTACIPSKSMLHDAALGRSWDAAVRRRDELTAHRDDTGHADELASHGATLVRARARIGGAGTIVADGREYGVRHVVVATGSEPIIPQLDGDALATRGAPASPVWTSEDALTAAHRPDRIVIVGAGVIGCELATIFARFGTSVTLVGDEPSLFGDLVPEVGDIVAASLRDGGVRIVLGRTVRRADIDGVGVCAQLDDGTTVRADRLLLAVGKRARVDGIGLDTVGVQRPEDADVDVTGRLRCTGSVWAIGDAAGRGQYTHLANHHARVVAANLLATDAEGPPDGEPARRFDDAVLTRCTFTDPPVMEVGPTRTELAGDVDIAWVTVRLDEVPRSATDELGPGLLAMAGRRSTGLVVAAHGVGQRVDELSHTVALAIDGRVPLDVLHRQMYAFPTVGEVVGVAAGRLAGELSAGGE